MAIKVVFFDVGGTLLSSDSSLFQNMAKKLNIRDFDHKLRKSFFDKKRGASEEKFKTIIGLLSDVLIENGFSPAEAESTSEFLYKKSFVENGAIYPDTLLALNLLSEKDIKLGIISDADWNILKLELEKFGLLRFFSSFSVSSEVRAYKPDGKIFAHALKSANVLPEESIYVGDTPEDIIGAKNMSIRSVLINRLHKDTSKIKIGPDFEVASLADIHGILKSL
ncbi:MAG: HAD family hydrolase [archaeon]